MKKIIRLTESQIIKLIKNVISESILPDLTYNQFEPILDGDGIGYELKDMGESIDYIGTNSKQKKNPKVEYIVKFYKKPENQQYKVEVISPDSNNDFGVNMVGLIDDEIIKEFKKPENGGIDFGSVEKSEASPYGDNIYYVELDELETFKNVITNFMNKYGV